MKVTDVTNDDGRMMAQLINFLGKAQWPSFSSRDAEVLVEVKRWAAGVAGSMATSLSRAGAAPSSAPFIDPEGSTSFKIKAMGSLDSPKRSRKKK